MTMYVINLADGKRLDGLTKNGNMFVSQSKVTMDDFSAAALKRVAITEAPETGEPVTTVVENAVCDTVLEWPEGYLFNIREKTLEEAQAELIVQLQERIEFDEACLLEMSEEVYK